MIKRLVYSCEENKLIIYRIQGTHNNILETYLIDKKMKINLTDFGELYMYYKKASS